MPGYRHFLQSRLGIKDDVDSFIEQWSIQQRKIVFGGKYLPFREVLRKSLKLTVEKNRMALPNTIEDEDFLDIFSNIKPFPEVPAALRNLKKKAKIGIITNSDGYMLTPFLPKLGVQIDMLLSAETIRKYKPNRQAYQQALDALSVPMQEILFVSGTPWDVKAAVDFGYTVAFIERHAILPEINNVAKYTLKNLSELIRIVNNNE